MLSCADDVGMQGGVAVEERDGDRTETVPPRRVRHDELQTGGCRAMLRLHVSLTFMDATTPSGSDSSFHVTPFAG